AGDFWRGGGGGPDVQDFFTITLMAPASFRLGVIGDQTTDNPSGLINESSDAVQVVGPDGADSGLLEGPDKDSIPDYYLFDITGDAGDVFTIMGRNNTGWNANALGGFFIDPTGNPDGPEISSFTANPTETATPGAAINFTWKVEMPLSSLRLQPGNIDVLGSTDGAGAGTFNLNPGPNATTDYTLAATFGGETRTATRRVTIIPPVISSFTSDKPSIAPGEALTLSWQVDPPATLTSLTLQPGDINVLGNTNASGGGSRSINPGPGETTTYRLVAVRGASATAAANALVRVVIPGAGITVVGVDIETNDAWRTTDVVKPFGDADNVYGTDGYLIAQLPNGDAGNQVDPPYATIALAGGLTYEGAGAERHQSEFDDVTQIPGPGPIPNLVCGDYYISGGADGNVQEFFTITLTQSGSFRLGVIGDQTVNSPNNLFWEASRSVQVTGLGGADSGLVYIAGTGPGDESWRNGDVDYALFDITGLAGDVFTGWGENDSRWTDNALAGVFFDPVVNSGAPRLTVERSGGGDLLFKWDSEAGKSYNLLSATDLSAAAPEDWPIFGAHSNIAATPPVNTLTIPFPADAQRFFVISE
ncbi:MAG: hypothetical protein ACKV19_12480, partial [Verrucomicrobiales bacterium]